jgi:hypothetical protein
MLRMGYRTRNVSGELISAPEKLPEKLPENDGLFGIRRNLTDTGGTRPISPETKKAMETRAFQGFQGRGA